MNEKDLLHSIGSELISIGVTVCIGIMWGIRKLIGMEQRISSIEASAQRFESFKQDTDEKLDGLMTDVATIKADSRHNAESARQILDLLKPKRG